MVLAALIGKAITYGESPWQGVLAFVIFAGILLTIGAIIALFSSRY